MLVRKRRRPMPAAPVGRADFAVGRAVRVVAAVQVDGSVLADPSDLSELTDNLKSALMAQTRKVVLAV